MRVPRRQTLRGRGYEHTPLCDGPRESVTVLDEMSGIRIAWAVVTSTLHQCERTLRKPFYMALVSRGSTVLPPLHFPCRLQGHAALMEALGWTASLLTPGLGESLFLLLITLRRCWCRVMPAHPHTCSR